MSPFFRGRADLADTFLVAGVYNFPPQYSGPAVKTPFDDIDEITFDDPPNAGLPYRPAQELADARAKLVAEQVLDLVLRTLEARR